MRSQPLTLEEKVKLKARVLCLLVRLRYFYFLGVPHSVFVLSLQPIYFMFFFTFVRLSFSFLLVQCNEGYFSTLINYQTKKTT